MSTTSESGITVRKRPAVMRAVYWTGGNLDAVKAFANEARTSDLHGPVPAVVVLDPLDDSLRVWNHIERQYLRVRRGDWIVRGTKHELYPCAPEVFEEAFEDAPEPDGGPSVLGTADDLVRRLRSHFGDDWVLAHVAILTGEPATLNDYGRDVVARRAGRQQEDEARARTYQLEVSQDGQNWQDFPGANWTDGVSWVPDREARRALRTWAHVRVVDGSGNVVQTETAFDRRIRTLDTEDEDQFRVQLAGCLTAAEGHIQDPAREGQYGWSPAYEAVLNLRRRHDIAIHGLRYARAEIRLLERRMTGATVRLQAEGADPADTCHIFNWLRLRPEEIEAEARAASGDPIAPSSPLTANERLEEALRAIHALYGRNLGAFFRDAGRHEGASRLLEEGLARGTS